MSVSSQPLRDRLRSFVAASNWMGTVIVPFLLFFYGQRIENRIEAQRQLEEARHQQDEAVARSTALLANVAPLLFSNDVANVTFALQILAPGEAQIPTPIHPLLLEVITLYEQKNPELSKLALSVLTSKLSPAEIDDARLHIPQDFTILVGANPASAVTFSQAPAASRPAPAPQTLATAQDVDFAAVTTGILNGKYNVIIGSAANEHGAVTLAASTSAKLRAMGSDLRACWKQPVPPSLYFGIAVGNGVSLAEAQKLRRAARAAGFSDAFLRRVDEQPTPCNATS